MFQREFARRLVVQPGDKLYCRLTVNTQLDLVFAPRLRWIPLLFESSPGNRLYKQKSVINLLEKNYKTLQALNHATAQEEDTNDVMEFMDEDMGTDGVNAEGEISEFKKKVLDVLKKSGFEGERSSKLKLQQFLRPTFPV
ncbi:hypothetical protein EV1_000174 [Malus domestica]